MKLDKLITSPDKKFYKGKEIICEFKEGHHVQGVKKIDGVHFESCHFTSGLLSNFEFESCSFVGCDLDADLEDIYMNSCLLERTFIRYNRVNNLHIDETCSLKESKISCSNLFSCEISSNSVDDTIGLTIEHSEMSHGSVSVRGEQTNILFDGTSSVWCCKGVEQVRIKDFNMFIFTNTEGNKILYRQLNRVNMRVEDAIVKLKGNIAQINKDDLEHYSALKKHHKTLKLVVKFLKQEIKV